MRRRNRRSVRCSPRDPTVPKPMRKYKADIMPELWREEAQRLRDRVITLEGHREQWRRVAFRYRDALEAIEGGHVCDEGHREEARKALHNIDDSHPVDGAGEHKRSEQESK